MKKKFLAMMAFATVMSMGFTACGDDDDDEVVDNDKNKTENVDDDEESDDNGENSSDDSSSDDNGSSSEAKYYTFSDCLEKVDMLGTREISVATGDTVLYAVNKYWENNGVMYGPVVGYFVVTEATSEKIAFTYKFHPTVTGFDVNEILSSTYKYDEELSDADFTKYGYQCFGCIGVDYQTGVMPGSYLKSSLGYEGLAFYFEKKKGQAVLTNYPTVKYASNTDTTEEEDYPEVVFMKTGVQK